MEFNDLIYRRKSIRKYKNEMIPDEDIRSILDAARVAPSGKNCQNWHFVVLKNRDVIERLKWVIRDKNESIADRMRAVDEQKADRFEKFCRNFTLFITQAPVIILTFAKSYYPSGYHELKLCGESEAVLQELLWKANPGMQSIGAAMENMTLAAADMNYGSCWLTSANYAAAEIEQLLKEQVGFEKEDYFFAAMMSIGVPQECEHKSPSRMPLDGIYTLVE